MPQRTRNTIRDSGSSNWRAVGHILDEHNEMSARGCNSAKEQKLTHPMASHD